MTTTTTHCAGSGQYPIGTTYLDWYTPRASGHAIRGACPVCGKQVAVYQQGLRKHKAPKGDPDARQA